MEFLKYVISKKYRERYSNILLDRLNGEEKTTETIYINTNFRGIGKFILE